MESAGERLRRSRRLPQQLLKVRQRVHFRPEPTSKTDDDGGPIDGRRRTSDAVVVALFAGATTTGTKKNKPTKFLMLPRSHDDTTGMNCFFSHPERRHPVGQTSKFRSYTLSSKGHIRRQHVHDVVGFRRNRAGKRNSFGRKGR